MASAVALPHLRQSLFQLPKLWTRLPAFSSPLAASLRKIYVPLWSLWQTLFPPVVLAVPKSRTTHSAKRMRAAIKGLKEKQNIVHCPACGNPKLAHHLCPMCYKSILRLRKKDPARAADEQGAF